MTDFTILPFAGISPEIAASAFIAPGCRIIGDVAIGRDSSIWYNCVIRGDVNRIRIGARTNIQDGSVVHVTGRVHPTEIGDDVLIGHLAVIHGCKLHNHAFVGMGAIVMDGCEIGADGMLAAGGLLAPGKRIPPAQLWAGRPAQYVRDLTVDQVMQQRAAAARYVDHARAHVAALRQANRPETPR